MKVFSPLCITVCQLSAQRGRVRKEALVSVCRALTGFTLISLKKKIKIK